MDTYICLLFDPDDAVVGGASIVAAKNEADARGKALILLREAVTATGFELWLRGEKIYTYFPHRNQNSVG